jgi:glycosyltransferase involved in cell wall biosynthesis
MKKVCLIYNIPSHYRESIYRMLDAEYDCDWYFGPTTEGIKEMDTSILKNVSRYKVFGDINKVFWNCGVLRLLFMKKYQNYFMLFESRCVTSWIFFILAFILYPRKKYYIWTHAWYGKESGVEAFMKKWIYKHVTGVFTYGEYAKKLLVKEGIPSDKLHPIRNSLSYDTQIKLRDKLKPTNIYREHFNNSLPIIIFIGRLTKVKQLDLLINAVAKLRDSGSLYNLVFVGDGVEKENLENKVNCMNLNSQVWFFGACYDEGTNAELVYNADLCVAPGNIGLTAIHVLMFGCPAVSHGDFKWQMPEFEAIIPGKTGDFFKKDDACDLAATIHNWFANNSNKRDEVRKNCYNEIDNNWNPYVQIEVIKQNLNLQ